MTFSLRPRRGRSLAPPFPPSRPQAFPAGTDFLILFLLEVMRMATDQQAAMEQLRALYREKNEHLEKFLEPVTPFEFYREIFPVGSFERKGHFEDEKGNGIAVTVPPRPQGLPWRSRRKARPNATPSPMSCLSCRRSLIRTLRSCPLCLTLGGGGAARMPGISMPWSLTWMGWVCPSSGTRCTR